MGDVRAQKKGGFARKSGDISTVKSFNRAILQEPE